MKKQTLMACICLGGILMKYAKMKGKWRNEKSLFKWKVVLTDWMPDHLLQLMSFWKKIEIWHESRYENYVGKIYCTTTHIASGKGATEY